MQTMPQIYQTDNMELAVRTMTIRNELNVLFEHSGVKEGIRLRGNLIKDIDSILCHSWDKGFQDILDRWRREKTLLHYKHLWKFDNNPECEAMLYVQCPYQITEFNRQIQRVSREVIVYRPPSWRIHDARARIIFPASKKHKGLIDCIRSLKNRSDLSDRQLAAIEYAGFVPENTSCFSGQEIAKEMDLEVEFVRSLLKKGLRHYFVRYKVYLPIIEPEDSELLIIYKILEQEKDVHGGARMLKFGELDRVFDRGSVRNRVKGFGKLLKVLVKQNYVKKLPDICIVNNKFKDMDYEIFDCILDVRRNRFEKIKNLVDESPKYPLILEIK